MKINMIDLTDEQVVLLINHIEEKCGFCHVLGLPCTGHVSPRHILTERFIPLALTLAKKYANNINREDLRGVALLTLVEIIDRVEFLDDTSDITRYINFSIMMKLKQYVIEDNYIKYSRNAGKKYDIKKLSSYSQLEEHKIADNYSDLIDLREAFSNVIKNEIEKTVLEHLVKGGYKDIEIARKLNLSKSNLSRIKSSLIERLQYVLQ